MGIDPREKVSGDWWSQPRSEFGSKVSLLAHHMTCIHVAGCWKVDWIGWGEGAPELTGAGHAQHSKEATIACGLQRFQGLLVPFRSWGSPATVLASQFQRCCSFLFDAGRWGSEICLGFVLFQLSRSFFLCSAARMQSSVQFQVIPDVVQLVADCTSTDESLFFLTTGRFLSCTTMHKKVKSPEEWAHSTTISIKCEQNDK